MWMLLTHHSDLDDLATFDTLSNTSLTSQAPTRYAVRQVLDQEVQKTIVERDNGARRARYMAGNPPGQEDIPFDDKENVGGVEKEKPRPQPQVRTDFFGRVIKDAPLRELDRNSGSGRRRGASLTGSKVKTWVK